jgi:hypothetical protein
MLTDCPNTIVVRCGNRKELVNQLLNIPELEEIKVGADDETLYVTTRSSAAIFNRLPELNQRHDLKIRELRSADSSLQQLFSALMQIHRGQNRAQRGRNP